MVLKTSEDFLVFDIFVQKLFDERPNNVSSVASESVQNSFFFVKFPKRATRFGVNVQTVLNSFGLIIISLQRGRKFKFIFNSNYMSHVLICVKIFVLQPGLNEWFTSDVINTGNFWVVETGIIHSTRGWMGPSRGQTVLFFKVKIKIFIHHENNMKRNRTLITSNGTLRSITASISTFSASHSACFLVRGKPSNKTGPSGISSRHNLVTSQSGTS